MSLNLVPEFLRKQALQTYKIDQQMKWMIIWIHLTYNINMYDIIWQVFNDNHKTLSRHITLTWVL